MGETLAQLAWATFGRFAAACIWAVLPIIAMHLRLAIWTIGVWGLLTAAASLLMIRNAGHAKSEFAGYT